MRFRTSSIRFVVSLGITTTILSLAILPCVTADDLTSSKPIDFRREVLPILSDRCFLCHGPDEETRELGLRLDKRTEAVDFGAIAPEDADGSTIIERMTSDDPSLQMPPLSSGKKKLTPKQVKLIRQWINEGAEYQKHWSFEKPTKAEIPHTHSSWPRNAIDYFVLDRLKNEKLKPSPSADKRKLARRAALSVVGLPPTEAQLNKFLNDDSDNAYEKYVDRLLASKRYGERMAYVWLDIARYSDTDGFQADEPRNNWPWRDWVVNAYNENMSFDRFTIEQFAGDLLPEATIDQKLATCFHRNHMTNGEGGRDPAESRVDYVLDRVNTMGTTWLGLTLGCAQCHSHKYDPITQHEYYQLSAFFNSIDEDGRAGKKAKPYLDYRIVSSETLQRIPRETLLVQRDRLNAIRESALSGFEGWVENLIDQRKDTAGKLVASQWRPFQIDNLNAVEPSVKFQREPDREIWRVKPGEAGKSSFAASGKSPHTTIGAIRLEALPHKDHKHGGLSNAGNGNFILTDVVVNVLRKRKEKSNKDESDRAPIRLKIESGWADFEQKHHPIEHAFDTSNSSGWGVLSTNMKQPRTAIFRLSQPFQLRRNDRLQVQLVHYSHESKNIIGRLRISCSPIRDAVHPVEPISLVTNASSVDELDKNSLDQLLKYYQSHSTAIEDAKLKVRDAKRALENAKKQSYVKVMVLKEREKPRKTFVLERGVWNAHGNEVAAKTPEALNELAVEGKRATRLDLAKWLVNRENPLTARVTVNRYWQMHFGAGLVRTPEDFGLQGEHPTHPKLLDWLAVEFMESGWDIKHIQKLIVTSATFRQSSKTNAELLEKDPSNRLLTRGPRFRMPAALIRDNALAASGLLADRAGGPAVKPYQPPNVWASSDQGRYPYVVATGNDLHRRSLYTYWRRNISPPSMFDAAQRRVCQVQTIRTNSPMHALNLLNDTTYIEAAKALALKVIKQESNIEEQISIVFESVLARKPSREELQILAASWNRLESSYRSDSSLAVALLQQGELPVERNSESQLASLAAMTVISSTILNMDETLNLE